MSPTFLKRPIRSSKTSRVSAVVFASIVAFICAPPAQAGAAPEDGRSDIRLADVLMTDRNGRQIRFATEAVGDRIVAINFIYTNCRTLCPFASATFKLTQDRLGDRLGREVRLISLSIDPSADTPERLKEFSDSFEPAPGWLWLTGQRQAMDSALQGLGIVASDFKEHAPLTLVGDAKFGRWTQFNSLPNPTQIEAEINRLWAMRRDSSTVPQSRYDGPRAP